MFVNDNRLMYGYHEVQQIVLTMKLILRMKTYKLRHIPSAVSHRKQTRSERFTTTLYNTCDQIELFWVQDGWTQKPQKYKATENTKKNERKSARV